MAIPITLDSWFHSREMDRARLMNKLHMSSAQESWQIGKVKSQVEPPLSRPSSPRPIIQQTTQQLNP
jgi:hypothetical protein